MTNGNINRFMIQGITRKKITERIEINRLGDDSARIACIDESGGAFGSERIGWFAKNGDILVTEPDRIKKAIAACGF